MKGQVQKVVVLLLFVICLGAIFLCLPRDFEKAMGGGFDPEKVEKIDVYLLPVEGKEPLGVTIQQGDEAFGKLLALLEKSTYSRTVSKSKEITLGYEVKLSFATGESWAWQYQFMGGKLVEVGPSGQTKTYQISGGEETQQAILDYLLTLELDPS